MQTEVLKHIENNQALFRFWISRNEKLQSSSDLLSPLIPDFVKENPGVNVNGCPECIIDMLRWAIKQLKETDPKAKK